MVISYVLYFEGAECFMPVSNVLLLVFDMGTVLQT